MAAWSPSRRRARARPRPMASSMSPARRPRPSCADADLVVLAGPATVCLPLIDRLAGPWRDGAPAGRVVTDVASTKKAIVARADAAGLRFVGGHPMAGLETAGYEASDARPVRRSAVGRRPGALAEPTRHRTGDRAGRRHAGAESSRWTPPPTTERWPRSATCRSSSPRRSSRPSPAGDAVAAAARPSGRSRGLAAGGWRDMSRLALGDPAMGAAIAVTNAHGARGSAARPARRPRRLAGGARPARRPR